MALGWQNNPPYSISEAESRGDDVYEVLVTGWGYPDGVNMSALQWPPAGEISVPVSLAGIAIGPRSTVDRCWVSYNLNKTGQQTGDGVTATDRLRYLSRDAPLIYTQQASPGTTKNTPGSQNDPINTMVKKGCLYVYPGVSLESTFDPNYYDGPPFEQLSTIVPSFVDGGTYTDVNGVVRIIGIDAEAWAPPTLHLLCFLKPIIYTPQKRSPLLYSDLIPVIGGSEQCIAQIPTFGRRSMHIMMMAKGGAGTATFRVGALRGMKFSNSTDAQEAPVDSISTPVAVDTPTILSYCAGQDVYADYINLYATRSANGNILFQTTFYD
jgi:hypothetical protein